MTNNQEQMPDEIWVSTSELAQGTRGGQFEHKDIGSCVRYIRQSSISVPENLGEALDYFDQNPQKNPNVNGYFNSVLSAARELLRIKGV